MNKEREKALDYAIDFNRANLRSGSSIDELLDDANRIYLWLIGRRKNKPELLVEEEKGA